MTHASPDPTASPPFVSVVVPTWNRAALLGDCLRALRAQDYAADRFEIVVVDDGSTDATAEVVRAFVGLGAPEVRYLRAAHGGLNAARNAGLAATVGDPVCFVDDDADVPPAWLAAVVSGVRRHPDAGCLGGPVRLRFEVPPPRICEMESWIWEAELDYGPEERTVPHVNGCNLIVRRRAIDAVGPFDASLPLYGDETEWEGRLERAGLAIQYLPAAWVWHRRTAADLHWRAMVRRRFRQGRAYAAYARVVRQPVGVWRTLWPIPFYLAHAVRRRCFGAVLEVARKAGIGWGALRDAGASSRAGGERR